MFVGETPGRARRRNLVKPVLDQVQMLDQQIAAARPVAEQLRDLLRRRGIDLTALGCRSGALASLARMGERTHCVCITGHLERLHVIGVRVRAIRAFVPAPGISCKP